MTGGPRPEVATNCYTHNLAPPTWICNHALNHQAVRGRQAVELRVGVAQGRGALLHLALQCGVQFAIALFTGAQGLLGQLALGDLGLQGGMLPLAQIGPAGET